MCCTGMRYLKEDWLTVLQQRFKTIVSLLKRGKSILRNGKLGREWELLFEVLLIYT